jgi:hypothetical protein
VIRSGAFENHIRAILHLLLNLAGVFWSTQRLLVGIKLLLSADVDLIFRRSPIDILQLVLKRDGEHLPFRHALELFSLPLGCNRFKTESRLRE